MADRLLPTGTTVANNYRVTGHLGSGGMGTVYIAHNLTLEQQVVVKVLQGETKGAGQEEAQTLANLQHPGVVQVFAYDTGLDCIVMEYLNGTSLASWLREELEAGRMLDPVQCIRVSMRMAEALAAVHGRGLVHRDIKPANVMMGFAPGRGRQLEWLKLIDFGLALKVGRVPAIAQGTPEYAGPEMFQLTTMPTAAAATSASDIYALGMTLFELLTGSTPFVGKPEQIAAAQLGEPPPGLVFTLERQGNLPSETRIQELLAAIDELLQAMLNKEPGKRPDALRVAGRLERIERQFSEAGTFIGRVPQGMELPKKATTTQLARMAPLGSAVGPTPTQRALAAGIQPGRSRRAMAAGAALLLALLAVWYFWPTAPGPVAEALVDAGLPMGKVPEALPPVAEAAIDAGTVVAAIEPMLAEPKPAAPTTKPAARDLVLAPIPSSKVSVVAVKNACTFDDRYRTFMRRRRTEMLELVRQQNRVEDPVVKSSFDRFDEAMEERDCAKGDVARATLAQALGIREE
jgi:eukaryotic-like serine/threonine-protein kinase